LVDGCGTMGAQPEIDLAFQNESLGFSTIDNSTRIVELKSCTTEELNRYREYRKNYIYF